jgi:hypothetical protein
LATHHAVGDSPNGELVDVTPFHADPKHQPLTPKEGSILFLFDPAASPVVTDALIAPLPLRYFARSDDERLASHVERLRHEEEPRCRDIYEGRA